MKRAVRFFAEFLSLDRAEQSLFAGAALAMIAARAALLVCPVHVILDGIRALNRRHPAAPSSLGVRRAAWRVAQAARHCPLSTTCLSESLAAHFIMSRMGFPGDLRIGVSKADGKFAAHAWLECPGGVVVGSTSPDGKHYTAMPVMERFTA